MANVDAAHHSAHTDQNAAPVSLGRGYYTKPPKTQMCQHLLQQSHRQLQLIMNKR